ncbi:MULTISPECIES: hypothetical protein [Tenacibaculum]|uniref:hypothetical protein n=1 Tax=Tenacibaculum TaxID=104267 RepID=UPI001F0B1B5A|nr:MULTISPECIES: hypothetical protein [Tenacibaculum]MCH3882888.1 hypothetical protein [Tenacibaculum aquimarinum]MDO6600403.1 hypothetical protein [Tenacibaculum sp. 1_MG-2023]
MKTSIKIFLLFFISILFNNCTTADLVESWKSPDIDTLTVTKVLVIGMTPNIQARREFEKKIKDEYTVRGIEAVMSLDVLDPNFTFDSLPENQIKIIENILTSNFYDAVLFTKVKGVEDRVVYNDNFERKEYLDVKFKEDYNNHLKIINDPKYYDKYKVYHAETSLYCICPTKDRELVWKGSINIVDPTSVEETVNDYVNVLILAMEELNLLPEK